MKMLQSYGTWGFTAISLVFFTTVFAADQAADGVGKHHEPSVTVQTCVKITRKLKNGQFETLLAPSILTLVGQKAMAEVTLANGENVTFHIETKIVPSENDKPASVKNSDSIE